MLQLETLSYLYTITHSLSASYIQNKVNCFVLIDSICIFTLYIVFKDKQEYEKTTELTGNTMNKQLFFSFQTWKLNPENKSLSGRRRNFGKMDSLGNITTDIVDPTDIFGPQRDALFVVIPITTIYSLIFVTGILGNVFTCLVIVRNKSMHTATNYYLFSLAISDLLLLVSGMPQEMYSIWSKWPYVFGNTFCVLRGLAAETSTNASVLTITLFTIERYLAICYPFVSHKMSKLSRAVKHVMSLWVVAFGLALPQALQFGIKEANGVVMCLQTQVIVQHSFEISTFVFFLAPMVVISVLYALIGMKLRETSLSNEQKDVERNMSHTRKTIRKHCQSTRRVVKMLGEFLDIAFYSICFRVGIPNGA